MTGNKILTVSLIGFLCLIIAFAGFNTAEAADTFPEEDFELIIPWPAGGFTDVAVRPIADWLENYFGVNVVVNNIEGGGGVIGSKAIETADSDGYTFGTTSISTVTAKLTSPDPPDMDNVEAIAQIFTNPATLTVHADSQWESLAEFVEYAQEYPGTLTVANTGIGASVHIFALAFEQMADINVVHVPYEGAAPATTSILGQHVEATMNTLPDVADHVRAGDLRMLAIATEERHEDFPEVPTFREEGYDYTMGNYTGFLAPKGVDQAKIEILEAAVEECITQDDEIREFLLDQGYTPEYLSSEAFREKITEIDQEIDRLVEEGLIDIDVE